MCVFSSSPTPPHCWSLPVCRSLMTRLRLCHAVFPPHFSFKRREREKKNPAMTSAVKPAPPGCLSVGKWSVFGVLLVSECFTTFSVRLPTECFGRFLDSSSEVSPDPFAHPAPRRGSAGCFTKVPEVPFEEPEMDKLALTRSRVVS